jgi:hypothetical protein
VNDHSERPPGAVVEQLHELVPTYCSAVLQYFHQHSAEVATVNDLAAFIHEQDSPDEDESRVAIHLYHATLPKLAEKDLIDYDSRSQTARYRGPPAGVVEE